MITLQYKSKGKDVHVLEEMLVALGYEVYVSNFFGSDTDAAVRDFQRKNGLVVDGIVGPKTWAVLIEKHQVVTYNNKLLSEEDLLTFAQEFELELATVKAVNEVESRGKGFLLSGRPVILFEGHIFWKELTKRGLNPALFQKESTQDILYKRWTRKHYVGGEGEYGRLQRAIGMSNSQAVEDAAYCSASWGAFQIMGFHHEKLGFPTVQAYVEMMNEHEREHLRAFGQFIKHTVSQGDTLLHWLQQKNWTKFARGYNGPGFRTNRYHTKMRRAYAKYAKYENQDVS